ncbi:hypothetical protein BDW74DRAFT_164925 [Aspergillus multicolor]|uniref:SDR family NAD(P)-dependent oxidoreductase n=1 Tax=Aspergillus multicolor TaxID=41759 RepID=UPI003CCDA159
MSTASYTFPGTAVITGAAGGIGRATALAFAAAGCTCIAITDLPNTGLDETERQIQSATSNDVDVLVYPGDISDESFVNAFVEESFSKFKRLDYVINCAGVLQKEFLRTTEVTSEQFDRINGINYRGTWLVSRAALRIMVTQDPVSDGAESWRPKTRGSIVNIASQLGVVSRAGAAAYCASKSAIIGLTRADAIDFSKDLIRVNCVCPGVIDTNMTTADEETRKALEPAVRIAPMARMGDAREVADAVLFLASNKASFVQGHAMVVDGGYVIN